MKGRKKKDSTAPGSVEPKGTLRERAKHRSRAYFTKRAKPEKRHRLLAALDWYELRTDPILSSTRQAEAINPALVSTHPAVAGPLMGVDVETGQPVMIDPHELYNAKPRRITSPVVAILGAVGSAKSSLGKTQYGIRPLALGRQVVTFDRKRQSGRGEYHRAVEFAGGTILRFDRAGGCVINLLDPAITRVGSDEASTVGQDELLMMVAEQAHGELNSKERHALRAAHAGAIEDASREGRVATIRDVIDHLYEPSSGAIPRENLTARGIVDRDDVTRWGLDLALDLERFVTGDLSGLIDGPTQSEDGGEIDLTAPFIVIDTSALGEESPALALVMAIMASYLSAVWSQRPGLKRIIEIEEGYHMARFRLVASIFRSIAKRSRGTGIALVTMFHHLSDVEEGSDAMSLIREAGVVHIYNQDKADDAEACVKLFQLPDWVGEELMLLDPGEHFLRIGAKEPVRRVKHIRTEAEEWITDTDEAMAGLEATAAPFASAGLIAAGE